VIPAVQPTHNDLDNLIWYLFSQGKCEEHKDPHLIAAWEGSGDLAPLEPPAGPSGRRDCRALIEMLAQPVNAAHNRPKRTVWHCPVSAAPEDHLLTDGEWAEVAREVMDATGLAKIGDVDAVRWIAVRHADNHIHIAATLVRQDGRTEPARPRLPERVGLGHGSVRRPVDLAHPPRPRPHTLMAGAGPVSVPHPHVSFTAAASLPFGLDGGPPGGIAVASPSGRTGPRVSTTR
jgi:hypothetical protein